MQKVEMYQTVAGIITDCPKLAAFIDIYEGVVDAARGIISDQYDDETPAESFVRNILMGSVHIRAVVDMLTAIENLDEDDPRRLYEDAFTVIRCIPVFREDDYYTFPMSDIKYSSITGVSRGIQDYYHDHSFRRSR